jgi:uncharacterized protein
MKPRFQLAADGKELTGIILPLLKSLTVTDETGEQADKLSIVLTDTSGTLELPKRGAILTLKLGLDFGFGPLVDFGQFTVDSVTVSGPPNILQIDGHAVPMAGKGMTQQRKSRSWPDAKIGDIVKKIAEENHALAVVATEQLNFKVGHFDQTDESDMSFLARIARDVGGACKFSTGRLAFVMRGAGQTATGKAMDTVELKLSDVSTWSCTLADREAYKSAIAVYRDLGKAKTVEVVIGQGEPVFRLPHQYQSESAARRAATARLADFGRGSNGKVQLEMPGRLDLSAESRITLTGIRQGVDGQFVARRVTHTLQKSGLTTSVEAESMTLEKKE